MNQKKNTSNKIIITVSVIIIFIILIIVFYFLITFLNKKVEEERNRNMNFDGPLSETIDENNENVTKEEISNETIKEDFSQTLDRRYGKIEIVFASKDNKILSEPEIPVLKGMKPVTFNRKNAVFEMTNENDSKWYNYSQKIWANAVDENGSFFVWIPRFAYKIVYYSDNSYGKIIGYCDARGLLKTNNDGSLTRVTENNPGLVEIGNHYILHPAFMNDYNRGYSNGGWDKDISGMWISKFEVSMENNKQHIETDNSQAGNVSISDSIKIVSKPGVSSWRNINISNAYLNSYNYNRERESHLMKNSEWGAIAYFSYSKYGTNSEILSVNSSNGYITGDSNSSPEVYNNKKNESSNKNQTGIYDLSGGAWEYVASFINNGNLMAKIYGKSLYDGLKNTKYKTIYSNDKTDEGNQKYEMKYAKANYLKNLSLIGDSIVETSTEGYGNYSWNTNSSFYVQQDMPFFIRGGDFAGGTGTGLFSYNSSNGQPNAGQSFRVVLVCE